MSPFIHFTLKRTVAGQRDSDNNYEHGAHHKSETSKKIAPEDAATITAATTQQKPQKRDKRNSIKLECKNNYETRVLFGGG